MGIKKSSTFTEQEFAEAMVVADYQKRTFSNYIVHCVQIETTRRLPQVVKQSNERAGLIAVLQGTGHLSPKEEPPTTPI